MIDHKIACCQWINIPEGKRYIVPQNKRVSKCDCELLIKFSSVLEPMSTVEHSYIAPIRIMSFDIECCKIGRGFVLPELDPVSQIACVTEEHNPLKELNYIDSVVFALVDSTKGKSVKLPLQENHIRVCQYDCEATMLVEFAKYIFTRYSASGSGNENSISGAEPLSHLSLANKASNVA